MIKIKKIIMFRRSLRLGLEAKPLTLKGSATILKVGVTFCLTGGHETEILHMFHYCNYDV